MRNSLWAPPTQWTMRTISDAASSISATTSWTRVRTMRFLRRASVVGGPLGIFVLGSRDRHHLAVISFAAQPAEKGALEQLGVETVGLGAPVLARHGYARCVDNVSLDAACSKPARQPETVPAGLKGDGNAFDPASCFLRFLTPAIEQLQQCALVDRKLLQRLTLDARHDAGNEPARQTHFDHCDQCAVLFQNNTGLVQVVRLLHWGPPSGHISDDVCNFLAAAPIASRKGRCAGRPDCHIGEG